MASSQQPKPKAKSFTDRIRDRRFSAMHEFKCKKDRERERDAYDKQRQQDRANEREIARIELLKIAEKIIPANDIHLAQAIDCLVDIFELFKLDPRSTCPFSADAFFLRSSRNRHVGPVLESMGIGIRDVLSKNGGVHSQILFCLPEHLADSHRQRFSESQSALWIMNGKNLHSRTQEWLVSRSESLGGSLANWIEQVYDTDDSDDEMTEYRTPCGAQDYLVADFLNNIFKEDDICFKATFVVDNSTLDDKDWVNFVPHAWSAERKD